MKNEAAPIAANVVAAGTGVVAASNPQMFYNTPEWLSLIAIGGAVVLLLAAINGAFTLRRNMKERNKK